MFLSRNFRAVLVMILALYCAQDLKAQLVVNGGLSAQEMAEILVGSGLNIQNVELVCPENASGSFNGTFTNLGVNSGVILTTGQIQTAVGPNDAGGEGTNNGGGGDPDLDALIPGFSTFDACYLEFDFVPQGDTLSFNYVFGSEEYEGFVCSNYNDVFGFFIEGGTEYESPTNIAIVPGTTDVQVSINTVNVGESDGENPSCILTNTEYYVDNGNGENPDPNSTIQYDGFTTVLRAEAPVTPCVSYTLKLAVCDAGDGIFDSGVFIAGGSLSTNFVEITASTVATTAVGVDNPVEGCVNAVVTFMRAEGAVNGDLVVPFEIGGSAENGLDYESIPSSITIPDGETSYDLPINTISDLESEGQESVTISLVNEISCDSTNVQLVEVLIDEQDPFVVSEDVVINEGESVALSVSGGGGTYGWYPFQSLDDATSANPVASPLETTTYAVSSFFGDCFFQEEITVTVLGCEADAGEVEGPDETTICQFGTAGAASVTGANADFDYTYVITGPDDAETIVSYSEDGSFSASGLQLGDYCVYGMNYASEGEEALDLNVGTISELTGQLDACVVLSDCYTITIEACCISEAGAVLTDRDYVCSGGAIEVSAVNQVLDEDDILGFALHNSPEGNPEMDGFELYEVNASGLFSNDGAAPSNQQIYVSSLVGNDDGSGLVDLSDPCVSISAGEPVILLEPIVFEENEVCDWVIGEYTVTMAVYGGLPGYEQGEEYTIQGFYGGQLVGGQTFTIVIPATDGLDLNFSATDLLGCSGNWEKEIVCFKTPIELLEFRGTAGIDENLLQWTTASESNINNFELERSYKGISFELIAEVPSAGFDTNSARSYDFVDRSVEGSAYYRLSSRNNSGKLELGPLIFVERDVDSITGASIVPIPANNQIQVMAEFESSGVVAINILDITGKLIRELNRVSSIGLNQWEVDINDLPPGIYFLTMSNETQLQSLRFVKE